MTFKLHFTNEWLRRKIATDPDDEPTAGNPFGEPLGRWEVSIYDDEIKMRCMVTRSDDLATAQRVAAAIPAEKFPWITDMTMDPAALQPDSRQQESE